MVNIKGECINSVRNAQEIHEDLAHIQRRRRYEGKKKLPDVGGETYHRKWAKTYRETLRVLETNA